MLDTVCYKVFLIDECVCVIVERPSYVKLETVCCITLLIDESMGHFEMMVIGEIRNSLQYIVRNR